MRNVSETPSRAVIHKWAAASAATAGVLPVGLDAVALFGEEVLMVTNVAALFGQSLTKEVAKQALETGILGTVAGTLIFEGMDVGYPWTIPAKIAVATTMMEGLGHATFTFYEKGGRL